MHWFWEFSHYRKAAGDLILDRVFDHHEPGRSLVSDFGTRLTGASVDVHLHDSRERLEAFAKDNPEIAEAIKSAASDRSRNLQSTANCW